MRWPWHRPAADEYDDWYDEELWEDDEEGWNIQLKLSRLFRRRNAILSNITESRVVDMDSAITLLDPEPSQFETMLSKLARAASPAAQTTWLEDELMPRLNAPILTFDWPEAPACAR